MCILTTISYDAVAARSERCLGAFVRGANWLTFGIEFVVNVRCKIYAILSLCVCVCFGSIDHTCAIKIMSSLIDFIING